MEFTRMTAAEFRNFVNKKLPVYNKNKDFVARTNKFCAEKTNVGQKTFDSKKEAERYVNLRHLEDAGVISNLRSQVRFKLLDNFIYHGKKIRGIDYIADFTYERDGVKIAEDVKSTITRRRPEYIIKKKLFMITYSDWLFEEFI